MLNQHQCVGVILARMLEQDVTPLLKSTAVRVQRGYRIISQGFGMEVHNSLPVCHPYQTGASARKVPGGPGSFFAL